MDGGLTGVLGRRGFLRGMAASSLLPALTRGQVRVSEPASTPAVAKHSLDRGLKQRIDGEMVRYMSAMNAPGMQFALTDLHGSEYVASYGTENLQTSTAMTSGKLVQIGSISKSMAAICALQLMDEGKLDLHRPVLEYLPWRPWSMPLGPVTLHHILTHTTGLPEDGSLYFTANRWQHRQRYAPGTRYFYSNLAFNAVGHLVALCDGGTYQESLVKRVFEPAGMTTARPQIGGANWSLQAVSYIPAIPDAPYGRFDPLREAPAFHEETSASCVLASPDDMARYLRALLRGGVTDSGKRILSKAAFNQMTRHAVDADEWGKGAGYGYGVGVRTVDGDAVLVHTGGMVSFMSSMYLDLTGGVAAFASINAQQGYRPTPAVTYAVQALIAQQARRAMPPSIQVPAIEERKGDASAIGSAAGTHSDKVGSYVNDDPWQGSVTLVERDGKLYAGSAPLVPVGDGSFYMESDPGSPDRCAFDCVINGKARILLLNGTEYRRFTPPA